MFSSLRKNINDTKVFVHALVCIFAIASWADMNGIWVELPLLVIEAPEKWTLPSYIIIVSQAANIGPLLFVLTTHCLPGTKGKIEIYTSAAIILLSVLCSVLIGFLWDNTSYIGGEEHSTALLALNFFMAFGDCISSVSFYAFMAMMKPQYMSTLFIGEGLSGMIPAMMALGQGAADIVCVTTNSTSNTTTTNNNVTMTINSTDYYHHNQTTITTTYPMFETPQFSVKVYFIILSCILLISFIAFILLNTLPYCNSEFSNMSYTANDNNNSQVITTDDHDHKGGNKWHESSHELAFSNPIPVVIEGTEDNNNVPSTKNDDSCVNGNHLAISSSNENHSGTNYCSDQKFLCFQGIIVLINMTFTTFLASIQIYSTLPYGLGPYHLVTTLTQITNPVACVFAMGFMATSLMAVSCITLLGEMGVAYIIYMAATSPHPPLHSDSSGGDLSVAIWVIVTFLLVYAKVCVAAVMRTRGRRSLIWTGVSTQTGSLIGAIVGFLLVNHFEVFIDAPYC